MGGFGKYQRGAPGKQEKTSGGVWLGILEAVQDRVYRQNSVVSGFLYFLFPFFRVSIDRLSMLLSFSFIQDSRPTRQSFALT